MGHIFSGKIKLMVAVLGSVRVEELVGAEDAPSTALRSLQEGGEDPHMLIVLGLIENIFDGTYVD